MDEFGFYTGQSDDVAPVEGIQEPNAPEAENASAEVVQETSTVESAEQGQEITEQDVPDNFFIVPETFDSVEDERDWYKEKFSYIQQNINPSQEMLESLSKEQMEKFISEQEKLYVGSIEIVKALKTNPIAFMAQYVPEMMAKMGISPVLTEQQTADYVNDAMASEFGGNWKDRWDVRDINNFASDTAKMFRRQMEISNSISQQNARNQELMNSWNSKVINNEIKLPDEREVEQKLNESFESDFKDWLSREEFDSFISQAQQTNLSLKQIHFALNAEAYTSGAYQKGLEDGKKQSYNNAIKSGAQQVVPVQTQKPVERETEDMADIVRRMMSGGIGVLG